MYVYIIEQLLVFWKCNLKKIHTIGSQSVKNKISFSFIISKTLYIYLFSKDQMFFDLIFYGPRVEHVVGYIL